jgi:hypothetical protein
MTIKTQGFLAIVATAASPALSLQATTTMRELSFLDARAEQASG